MKKILIIVLALILSTAVYGESTETINSFIEKTSSELSQTHNGHFAISNDEEAITINIWGFITEDELKTIAIEKYEEAKNLQMHLRINLLEEGNFDNVLEQYYDGTQTIQNDNPQSNTMTRAEFDQLLLSLPVTISSTTYTVQDERYKALYPDMLQVILYNQSNEDIRNVVIAFAAWDVNNLPVKIKGNVDFSDGAYIKEVNFSDINLVPNSYGGEDGGFAVDENCGIASFQAIVVSYESFAGTSWKNPYYDSWRKLYEGVKYSDDLTVDINPSYEAASAPVAAEDNENSTTINEVELSAQIDAQEFKVIGTNYLVQSEEYKTLYPDMLTVTLINGTTLDIKNAVIAFAAWDANGLPVKIKGNIDFSDGAYIREVDYSDINMIPGSTYGDGTGFSIDENCKITSFKAIVASYEAFDGTKWINPLYEDWRKLYEGVKIGV